LIYRAVRDQSWTLIHTLGVGGAVMDVADLWAVVLGTVVLDAVVLGVFLGAAIFLVAFLAAGAARRIRTAGAFLAVRFLLFLALAMCLLPETGSTNAATQGCY